MTFHFKRGVPWFQLIFTKSSGTSNITGQEARRLLEKSKSLYKEYCESQESDEMTSSILASGTMKDKLTAMKVAAEETPLLTLDHLASLNEMMKGKPRIAIEAMHAAEQIYTKYLLPPDRALKTFQDQPLKNARDQPLVIFYFEDQLKLRYAEFVRNVESMAKGQQAFIRDPAIKCIGTLLKERPEAEKVLLAILVDKFGDPLKAVANVATSTILMVLKEHPQMTKAVIQAIRERKFDENTQKRAMKFIGQLSVGNNEDQTAQELFETVKPQLLDVLKSYDESKSKVLQSLMRPIEKCAASCSPKDMATLIDPLYEFLEKAPLIVAMPALHLLFSIHKVSGKIPQRFYEFLYKVLLKQDIQSMSKQAPTLNLLMEALIEEQDLSICCSFVHRLLHVGLQMNVAFALAVLVFIAKLFEKKPDLRTVFTTNDREIENQYDFENESPVNPGAVATFPWILSLYVTHYHPGIQKLARLLINGNSVVFDGDAFDDFGTTKQMRRAIAPEQGEESGLLTECFMEWDQIPDFGDDDDFIEERKSKREEYEAKKASKNEPKQKKQKKKQNNKKKTK